eukprot:gene13968-biopygen1476
MGPRKDGGRRSRLHKRTSVERNPWRRGHELQCIGIRSFGTATAAVVDAFTVVKTDPGSEYLDSRSEHLDSESGYLDSRSEYLHSRSECLDSRSDYRDSRPDRGGLEPKDSNVTKQRLEAIDVRTHGDTGLDI